MKSQIRIPISFNLDLVKPNKIVTSNGQAVMFKLNNKENIVMGWMLIAYMNGEALECISFKNGTHGSADVVDREKQQTKLINGNIQVFMCIPYKSNKKIPKIEIFISDMELNEV